MKVKSENSAANIWATHAAPHLVISVEALAEQHNLQKLDPKWMTDQATAARRLREIAGLLVPNIAGYQFDWTDLANEDCMNFQGDFVEALKELDALGDCDFEELSSYVEHLQDTLLRDKKPLTKDELETVLDFFAEPTQAAVKGNPLLSLLPEPLKHAQDILKARRIEFAKAYTEPTLEGRYMPVVLTCSLEAPTIKVGGDLQFWFYMEPGHTNEYGPWVHDIYASLITVDDDGATELIGYMTGNLILGALGGSLLSDNFWNVMDCHSQKLNDVWKVIQTDLLEANGYDSLEEWTAVEADESTDTSSIVVPYLTVASAYRGRGVGEVLLRALYQVTTDATHHNPYERIDREFFERAGSGMEGEDADEFEAAQLDMLGQLEGSPTRLIVLGIPGEPPEVRMASPLQAYSTVKLKRTKAASAVEDAKRKLMAHFQKMTVEDGMHVLCYDPYDYPYT